MSTIQDIKARLDIVEVVESYGVKLQPSGRNFKALCPFHSEKTPSFYVFPEGQNWHCFGACGTGGDAFSFVMKREGLTFSEVLPLLARRAGVTLVTREKDTAQEKELARLRAANEAAALLYHHFLLRSPEGAAARAYLEKRCLNPQTVADFQLGYSPSGKEVFLEPLRSQDYETPTLLAAGLVVEREGGLYPRFRGRIMFPIRDSRGQIAGFGARVLDDSLPKYLNSPQTPIFDKSGLLYGLHRARETVRQRKEVVIVEGYMDVLAAHQAGETNVVASMGTALSEKQLKLLKGLTNRLVLALDADAAGEEATWRGVVAAEQAMERKVVPQVNWRGWVRYQETTDAEIRVMTLPSGQDPDDVLKDGSSTWSRLVTEAQPVIEHLFLRTTSQEDLTQPQGKSEAAKRLLPYVAAIIDPVQRAHYLQKLARLVQVDTETLKRMMAAAGRKTRAEKGEAPLPSPKETLEEYCLNLLLRYPQLRGVRQHLSPEHFEASENRELFIAWSQGEQALTDSGDASLQEHRERLLSIDIPPLEEKVLPRALKDCVERLEERRLKRRKEWERLRLSEEVDPAGKDFPFAALLDGSLEGMDDKFRPGGELQRQGIDINTQLRDIYKGRQKKKG
ncbi:MAG: DNA primase [Chloroflexi bacterium]|nr:DNA primase [Chloroflexota bacterium]